ncbi:hypothetical protein TIFTF001_014046 [Ficus carica]|uniref:Uncharacterized protein n=1 Tax=Ficus carica TaxID=3494 RepID=A0AA88AIY7_FICCA|nr:hypothetical protein TIFTF001_014046 [Ficus carica]
MKQKRHILPYENYGSQILCCFPNTFFNHFLFPRRILHSSCHPPLHHRLPGRGLPRHRFLVHIFCEIFHRLFHEIHRNDLEIGDAFSPLGEDIRLDRHDSDALPASSAQNNLHILEMLDKIIRDLGEGRGSRQNEMMQKVLERLPPRVCYGTDVLKTSSSHECVVCLKDLKIGDSCQRQTDKSIHLYIYSIEILLYYVLHTLQQNSQD